MRIVGRCIAVLLAIFVVGVTGPARAQITGSSATNSERGSNHARTSEGGTDTSGDAIGGQVTGIVANGRTSVDARNTSRNSSIETGAATTANSSRSITGLSATGSGALSNTLDGGNRFTLTQAGDATSGDGVSGQVVGAVTGPGGSASIVAANVSDNNDVQTGVASAENDSDAFVGLEAVATSTAAPATASNNQTGRNRLTVSQTGSSGTGNSVAGQVVGVVSDGVSSVDANNTSTNNDVDTVATDSANASTGFVGLEARAAGLAGGNATAKNTQTGDNHGRVSQFAPGTANSSNATVGLAARPTATGAGVAATATNTQDGNNAFVADQSAPTSTSSVDSVAGQVVGDVTDTGGTSSLVAGNTSDNNSVHNIGVAGQVLGVVSAGATSVDALNTSTNNDVDGGVTSGSNDSIAFVGQLGDPAAVASAATATNNQTGHNRGTVTQSASTTGGVPVAGQVIGAVTAGGGRTSIVAADNADNNDVQTGDATASNSSNGFAGLHASPSTNLLPASATNTQTGNDRFTVSGLASATSGNGVAGEIIGVVSAGTTSVDARNASTDNDVQSAEASSSNTANAFVELLGAPVNAIGSNLQDGNNRHLADQSADATSGDAIAAQVVGVVTAAGGSSSAVVANTSTGLDVSSGPSTFDNSEVAFVGLDFSSATSLTP